MNAENFKITLAKMPTGIPELDDCLLGDSSRITLVNNATLYDEAGKVIAALGL